MVLPKAAEVLEVTYMVVKNVQQTPLVISEAELLSES